MINVVKQKVNVVKDKQNKGMAMLEVLIAMVVVAVGVLPLVYLQVKSDRSVVSAYTKVEHNAAALSIMDMIAADASKNNWEFNLVSGDCDSSCTGVDWRKKVTDDLLMDVLPNPGSGLVCIQKENVAPPPTPGAAPTTIDRSIKMTVTLWWYSAGRGKADIGGNQADSLSKAGAFTANDCSNLTSLANKLNIDTVNITRIF